MSQATLFQLQPGDRLDDGSTVTAIRPRPGSETGTLIGRSFAGRKFYSERGADAVFTLQNR